MPFTTYLSKLTKLIEAGNRKQRNIQLHIEAAELVLEPDLAIPLGLIVNELVTNAYKHAFGTQQGSIRIALTSSKDGHHELLVADNGSGLPEQFDVWKARSTGMRLVGVLVQQIKAQLTVEHEPETAFRIRFQRSSAE